MLKSDIAINNQEDDLLNRTAFVHNMADVILRWNKSESIVIALYGPWGSGKTSTINLIVDEINNKTFLSEKKSKPIIVWFNPWNIADNDQLLLALYQELILEIKNVEPKINVKDFWEKVTTFSDTLGALEEIPKIGVLIKIFRGLLKVKIGEKTIRKQKEDIDKLFKDLERRIIIIVDDIDRLETDEIRSLFRIIKMNADFPNTIFLTAFDRQVVECALTINDVKGRDYLEKIVQIGVNLPAIEILDIQEVLEENLERLIQSNELQIDPDRLARLVHLDIYGLFETLRTVKRYFNSLETTINLISGELDLVDFLAIEMIRVFLPNLYDFIQENKTGILIDSQDPSTDSTGFEGLKSSLTNAWESNGKSNEKIARDLSLFLFPQLERIFKGPMYARDYILDWRKNKRICSPEFFDTYFLFRVPSKNISQLELNKFIKAITEPDLLEESINGYSQSGKYRQLLRGIEDKIDVLMDDQKKILVGKLILRIDTHEDTYDRIFDIGSDKAQLFLIQKLLSSADEHDRFTWLQSYIHIGYPVFPIVSLVDRAIAAEVKGSPDKFLSKEHIDLLQTSLTDKIYEMAMDYSLLGHKGTPFVLGAWRAWETDEERINEFIKLVLSDSDHFLSFCQIYVYGERSDADINKIEKKIFLEGILKFLEKETLINKLKMLLINEDSNLSIEKMETLQLLKKDLSDDIVK